MPATILLVTDNSLWVQRDGTEQRLSRLHGDLVGAGFDVAVFYLGALRPKDHPLIRRANIRILQDPRLAVPPWIAKLPLLGRLAQLLSYAIGSRAEKRRWRRTVPAGGIPTLADFQNAYAKRLFDLYLERCKPDVVLIVKVHLAYLIEDLPRPGHRLPLLVIDTHDVMHQRAEAFARNGQKHWIAISREEEAQALSHFDIIMAIQSQEAPTFRDMLPASQVVVTPLSVSIGTGEIPARPAGPVRLGYLGSGGPSNLLALQAFIPQVFAALRERFGTTVEFHIAGKICQSLAPSAHPGIILRGAVADPAEFWDHVDIAVNPVQFGGGLKIKNVEALSRGCPLVTTSIGAQGMEQGAGSAFLLADTTESQTAVISTLIQDAGLRRSLGVRARAFAETHFSSSAAMAELLAAIAAARPVA